MTVPMNIPETPMAQPNSESHQESKDTNSSISMEVLQHVLQRVMDIKDEEEIKSLSKWMKHRGYHKFTDICAEFCHILDSIHDYSEFRLDGLRSTLKFSTMNKIRMFRSWMSTKMTNGVFALHTEDLLALTREQFNDFRQADMIRMMEKTSPPPSESTTPMTTLSGYMKGTAASESQAALNNFKKGIKRGASAYLIFKNDLNYDTFQRSFLATIKAQGIYDVADPDFEPYDGDQYDQHCIVCIGYFSPDREGKRTGQGI